MGLNTLSGLISGHWPQIVKSGYKTNKLIRLSITVKHAIQLENWLSGNRRKRLVIGNPRVKNIFIMFIKISAKVVSYEMENLSSLFYERRMNIFNFCH